MLNCNNLQRRTTIIQAVRRFFYDQGYLEVDTPILQPVLVPEAHITPLQSNNLFLQTSPELCMKMLLAAGNERIFQICKCFRANERGDIHLPEFTMLEWYRSESDYHHLMDDCERLVRSIAAACNIRHISSNNHEIMLHAPWQHISVIEAFNEYAPISLTAAVEKDLFDEIIAIHIEPHLGWDRPTILYDYPAQLASLARIKEDDPTVAERFELYIGGIELANGFSELIDATEQRQRFTEERERITAAGGTCVPMPEKFLQALKKMVPTAGIALGLDRLVMLFLGETSLDNSVSFTQEELRED